MVERIGHLLFATYPHPYSPNNLQRIAMTLTRMHATGTRLAASTGRLVVAWLT
jgi:hypothetical protein